MKKIIFSPIFFVAVVPVFLISSYWIYKNIQLEDIIGKDNVDKISHIEEIKSDEVFEIVNNNIVEIIPPDKKEIILKGEDIEDAQSLSDLSVSPDGKNLCFLVRTIVPVWLYVYDLDNETLIKVATAKNCFWSPDGKYIAYNNHTTDVSNIDVYLYSVNSGDIENITTDVTPTPTDLFRQCGDMYLEDGENLNFGCQLIKFTDIEDVTFIDVTYNIPTKKISSEEGSLD